MSYCECALANWCQELSVPGWFPFTVFLKRHHAELHMTIPFKRACASFAYLVFFTGGSLSASYWPLLHKLIHWWNSVLQASEAFWLLKDKNCRTTGFWNSPDVHRYFQNSCCTVRIKIGTALGKVQLLSLDLIVIKMWSEVSFRNSEAEAFHNHTLFQLTFWNILFLPPVSILTDLFSCPTPPFDQICSFFFFDIGYDWRLLLLWCLPQLMKRFGSLRGSKKRKDQGRSSERRKSEPHGLLGRELLCYPSIRGLIIFWDQALWLYKTKSNLQVPNPVDSIE